MLCNIGLTIILYGFWHYTQKFLEQNNNTNNNVIDKLHNSKFLSSIHNYLFQNKYITKILTIITTFMIDANLIYFFMDFIFNNNIRPIILLFGGVFLRQICQYINILPVPNDVLWFDPGFPSLIMNYNVSNDFFFSGHTLVSLIFGIELFLSNNIFIKIYALFYMMMEIFFVLVTRAHYFIDIYGAISTYFMMNYFYDICILYF